MDLNLRLERPVMTLTEPFLTNSPQRLYKLSSKPFGFRPCTNLIKPRWSVGVCGFVMSLVRGSDDV